MMRPTVSYHLAFVLTGAPHCWLNGAPVEQSGSYNEFVVSQLLNFLKGNLCAA
jgi:hypothetical protein